MAVSAEAARPTALVARGDAAYYMLSLAAVQGSAFFIQLLVAAALRPSDFAVVRTVEAWLSPLLVVAAAGLPSLAMAWVPARAGGARDALARQLRGVSLVTGAITAALTAAAALLFLPPPTGRYLALAAGLLALGALSRTMTNLMLAAGRVRATALATAAVSLVAIPVAAYGARHYGITGWMGARYLSEAALLLVVLTASRGVFPGTAEVREHPRQIVRVGGMLSASLLVRSVVDNLGPIAAARFGFGGVDIGAFALATVGVAAILLAPGAIGNLAIRRFAVTATQPGELRAAIRQGILFMLVPSVLPCVVFALAGELVLRTFFPQYQGTAALMSVVLWSAPCRAVTALMGGVLVAVHRSSDTLRLNLVCLAVAVALQWSLSSVWGVWGSAWAVLLTDIVTVLLYLLAVRWRIAGSPVPVAP